MARNSRIEETFARVAQHASAATGSFWAFCAALAVIAVWAVTGPLFDFSGAWQLVINTFTTIVTFLMVFLIQHAQNKENRALQLKLNELIGAVEGASNRLIDIEDLTDRELEVLYHRYQHLAKTAAKLQPGAHVSVERERDDDEAAARPRKHRVKSSRG